MSALLSSSDQSNECYRPKPRRQWFMHSSLRVLTTVTCCCSVSLTICSGVFRQYKPLPYNIGGLCDSALNSSSSIVATCEVPRTRTSLVDRSFTVAGPRQWSVEQPTVPLHLRVSQHSTYFPGVPPPVTEDALVLLRTASPSDCFCAPYKSAFTLQRYITLQNIISFYHNPRV